MLLATCTEDRRLLLDGLGAEEAAARLLLGRTTKKRWFVLGLAED